MTKIVKGIGWFLFGVFFLYVAYQRLEPQLVYLSVFFKNSGSYSQELYEYSFYKSTADVRKVVPPDARIQLSLSELDIDYTAMRYYLYPIQISNYWDYFLDFTGTFKSKENIQLERRPVYKNAFIYARPGNLFMSVPVMVQI